MSVGLRLGSMSLQVTSPGREIWKLAFLATLLSDLLVWAGHLPIHSGEVKIGNGVNALTTDSPPILLRRLPAAFMVSRVMFSRLLSLQIHIFQGNQKTCFLRLPYTE